MGGVRTATQLNMSHTEAGCECAAPAHAQANRAAALCSGAVGTATHHGGAPVVHVLAGRRRLIEKLPCKLVLGEINQSLHAEQRKGSSNACSTTPHLGGRAGCTLSGTTARCRRRRRASTVAIQASPDADMESRALRPHIMRAHGPVGGRHS